MLDGLSKLVTICNKMQRKSAAIVYMHSIMFDEASNIYMSGLLNVFVNLLTNDYQVISIICFKMHKLIEYTRLVPNWGLRFLSRQFYFLVPKFFMT
jgi:hypothetical protein